MEILECVHSQAIVLFLDLVLDTWMGTLKEMNAFSQINLPCDTNVEVNSEISLIELSQFNFEEAELGEETL